MTVGEWDQRQLCPDGGCVGLIGKEGTCNVCGRVAPNWGDERTRGLVAPEDAAPTNGDAGDEGDDDDEYEDDPGDEGDDEEGGEDGASNGDADGEWPERELCSDGACIGVIGADGLCKVCGKPVVARRPEAVAEVAEAVAEVAEAVAEVAEPVAEVAEAVAEVAEAAEPATEAAPAPLDAPAPAPVNSIDPEAKS
jgi:hypothetical protein